MYFLGINAYAHDSAVALLRDAEILGFAEQERFNRTKHTGEFPSDALAHLLASQNLELADIDEVGFFLRPWHLIASRSLRALRYLPRSATQFFTYRPGNAMRILRVASMLRNRFDGASKFRMRFIEHHLAHAASAFLVSPFEEAAILSIDGAGEDITTWLGRGVGTTIDHRHSVRLPHSIGLFYSAVTDYLGFRAWSGEGKVMGLAPYGDPARFYPQMRELLQWNEDGDVRVNLRHFDYHVTGWTRWVSPSFEGIFGPRREPESELTQRHKDVAAALQCVCEEAALALVRHLHEIVPSKNLCLAGGVALNSVMNGRIRREGPFEEVFIQPAANDAGTALGSALVLAHLRNGLERREPQELVFLGPQFDSETCGLAARASGLKAERVDDVCDRTADLLASGRVVGWFQGRMEVGPRALGNRSILADPRPSEMKDRVNLRVKHREPFRPFAPAVLRECVGEYFEEVEESPYMLLVAGVRPDRKEHLAAVTHVDGTARVQTVTREGNKRFHDLISAFGERTGTPVLLNTSFNVRGEPIVCTPEEAIECFRKTDMDHLVLEDWILSKS